MSSIELPTYPYVYRQKRTDIQSTFNVKLSPIVDAYMNTKLNPNITEYQTRYESVLDNIHGVQSKLFELKNDITNELGTISDRNQKYVDAIDEQELIEYELKEKLRAIDAANSGSGGLRKNMTDSYKLQYASNFFLIIGIIMTCTVIYFVFAKDIINNKVSILPI